MASWSHYLIIIVIGTSQKCYASREEDFSFSFEERTLSEEEVEAVKKEQNLKLQNFVAEMDLIAVGFMEFFAMTFTWQGNLIKSNLKTERKRQKNAIKSQKKIVRKENDSTEKKKTEQKEDIFVDFAARRWILAKLTE